MVSVCLGKDYDITSGVSTKYIFLGDRRIAMKDSSSVLLFYHEDHINSSNVMTDASGDQAGLLEYDPYGATVTHTGSADPKHKFTGQEEDPSAKLYYYGARYMDPQLGRFISADPTIQHPADPQDFNRYAYARNNPIRFTDPTGFGWFSKVVATVVGVVVGVVVGYYTGNYTLGVAAGFAAFRATETKLNGGSDAAMIRSASNGYEDGMSCASGDDYLIGTVSRWDRLI